MWTQDGLGAGAFTVIFKNSADGKISQLDLDVLAKHGMVSKISA